MEKYLKNRFVTGSIVLILVCIVLAVASGGSGNSPEGTVHKLEKALNSGNEKKILSCYDSDLSMSFKMEKAFDTAASLVKSLGYADGKVKFLVKSVEKDSDNEAVVSCIEIFTDKSTKMESVSKISLNLEKQNGKWVIKY